jgi:hypothetical protein
MCCSLFVHPLESHLRIFDWILFIVEKALSDGTPLPIVVSKRFANEERVGEESS